MHIALAILLTLYVPFVSLVETNSDIVCSPYSIYNEILQVCVCPNEFKRYLHCNEYGYIDAVKDCACVTYNEDTDEVEVGYCVYGCSRDLNTSYSSRLNGFSFIGIDKYQWNQLICGPFQRTGTLCGSCTNGSYPPAYCFDAKCIQCMNDNINILKYMLWAFFPLTVFCFTLLLLQINILSSPIFGLVIYSQIVSQNSFLRSVIVNKNDQTSVANLVRTLGMLYGIWNLDFFRTFNHGFCLKSDALTILSLDFIIAIYPLFLMALTYGIIMLYDNKSKFVVLVLKPFHKSLLFLKRNWNIRTSTVKSFATFILLSNVKLLSTCLDILIPVDVYKLKLLQNFTVIRSRQVYSYATLEYLGSEHLPYAILALLVFCAFVFLPVFVLFIYPFQLFQYFLTKLPTRCILFLNTFVDSFQGCYKDGTQPNCRDYRLFSVIPFIFHWACFIIFALILNASYFPLATMITVFIALLLMLFEPLQEMFHGMSHGWIICSLFLAIFSVSCAGTDVVQITGQSTSFVYVFYTVCTTIAVLPFFYILLLILRFLHSSKLISVMSIRMKQIIISILSAK